MSKSTILNDSILKEIVSEVFSQVVQFQPNSSLLNNWILYIKKQKWNQEKKGLFNNLTDAINLMKKFYIDKKIDYTTHYNQDSFSPKGYEVCLKAEQKGLGNILFGDLNLTADILQDLVNMVDKGWQPFEIEWILTGKEPKGYVEIFFEDNEIANYGNRVIKEIIPELRRQYNFHPLDIEEVLIEFSEDSKNFKDLGKVVIKSCNEGFLDGTTLVYCKEKDWLKIKEKLKSYVIEELKNYYEIEPIL